MNKIYHCFFEQSGTFKNEFKKLGYDAYDYDILNDFNETDYQINLFNEILNAYDNKKSIFDDFDKDKDFIIAFFPCIRFEDQILLWFRGESSNQKNWNLKKKLERDLQLHKELNELYSLITKLVILCLNRDLSLIIENPYSTQHYLYRYWALKPSLIDDDRSQNGDYFKKPSQFFFVNFEPQNNFIFEAYTVNQKKVVGLIDGYTHEGQVERSLMSKEYANRFIREFIEERR